MLTESWVALFIFLCALTLIFRVLGGYLFTLLSSGPLPFPFRFCAALERGTYSLCGVDPSKEQTWKQYLWSLLLFSGMSGAVTLVILWLQPWLPLNPEEHGPMSWDASVNTAVSFMTNTNWQPYPPESTLSYFSQMVGLVAQNFFSAAVGLCAAAAFIRGIVRQETATVGNFWVDLVRIVYFLLLPLAIVYALFLIQQGVPQNFSPYVQADTIEGGHVQTIVQGPIASQEAIKLLGTNGGGVTNANAAHPYENPTPLSNYVQVIAMLALGVSQIYYFGLATRKLGHAWSIYVSLLILFTLGVIGCTYCEREGMPWFSELGIDTRLGNLEGKEVRFGLFSSALYSIATTASSCGSVDSMLSSYTPLGGGILLLNMQLGEVIFGGVGSGIFSIIFFVLLAVFIAGLIVGRTPEYMGKRLGAFDVKMILIALFMFFLSVLGLSAWAMASSWGQAQVGNLGPHGFTEILYAFSSAVCNNGSAFASLNANTPWYNYTMAVGMLVGRFGFIVPVLALAGSFAAKKRHPEGGGGFPLSGWTFSILFCGVIIVVGALTFLPALVMGPILEHFLLSSSKLF